MVGWAGVGKRARRGGCASRALPRDSAPRRARARRMRPHCPPHCHLTWLANTPSEMYFLTGKVSSATKTAASNAAPAPRRQLLLRRRQAGGEGDTWALMQSVGGGVESAARRFSRAAARRTLASQPLTTHADSSRSTHVERVARALPTRQARRPGPPRCRRASRIQSRGRIARRGRRRPLDPASRAPRAGGPPPLVPSVRPA